MKFNHGKLCITTGDDCNEGVLINIDQGIGKSQAIQVELGMLDPTTVTLPYKITCSLAREDGKRIELAEGTKYAGTLPEAFKVYGETLNAWVEVDKEEGSAHG